MVDLGGILTDFRILGLLLLAIIAIYFWYQWRNTQVAFIETDKERRHLKQQLNKGLYLNPPDHQEPASLPSEETDADDESSSQEEVFASDNTHKAPSWEELKREHMMHMMNDQSQTQVQAQNDVQSSHVTLLPCLKRPVVRPPDPPKIIHMQVSNDYYLMSQQKPKPNLDDDLIYHDLKIQQLTDTDSEEDFPVPSTQNMESLSSNPSEEQTTISTKEKQVEISNNSVKTEPAPLTQEQNVRSTDDTVLRKIAQDIIRVRQENLEQNQKSKSVSDPNSNPNSSLNSNSNPNFDFDAKTDGSEPKLNETEKNVIAKPLLKPLSKSSKTGTEQVKRKPGRPRKNIPEIKANKPVIQEKNLPNVINEQRSTE
jgi:hypothetical protein